MKPRTMSSETSRACFDGDGVATGVGAGGGALTGAMSDSVREVRSMLNVHNKAFAGDRQAG